MHLQRGHSDASIPVLHRSCLLNLFKKQLWLLKQEIFNFQMLHPHPSQTLSFGSSSRRDLWHWNQKSSVFRNFHPLSQQTLSFGPSLKTGLEAMKPEVFTYFHPFSPQTSPLGSSSRSYFKQLKPEVFHPQTLSSPPSTNLVCWIIYLQEGT